MISKKIIIIPGDGIGVEVTASSKLILEKIAQIHGCNFEFAEADMGHVAIIKHGVALPDETLELCQSADAILLGAVGHPIYDENPKAKVRPEQGLLKLRKELDLFANIRPIQFFDDLVHVSSLKPEIVQGVDILFFRELTSGIYFGKPRGRKDEGQLAYDTMTYTKAEVRRIARKAFEAARSRNREVCSVDKANVLESSRLWREVVSEVGQEYPDVNLRHLLVDNAAMQLIRQPKQFDVILTTNMFGDILTDLSSQITGSLGMLPSASLSEKVGLYEPIHGTAPDIAGKGIANPIASILSVALMLKTSFQMHEAGQMIVQAIDQVLKDGYRTSDIADKSTKSANTLSTQAITQKILNYINEPVLN